MEIKITFRFDASDQFLTCIDRLKEAAENIVSSGMIETLPKKERGVTKAIVTTDSVVVNKKERIYPPEEAAEETQPTDLEKMKAENPALGKMVDKLELEEVKEKEPKEPAPVPATLVTTEITEADIREAMQRVRDRIETQEDSAEKEKVHRLVTNRLKLTAEEIAGCKPSQIPTQEGRKTFIDRIENLEYIDGEVTFKPPF